MQQNFVQSEAPARDVRPRMHVYQAANCRDFGAELVRVGGVADHVHIVTTLARTATQAELVEQIKNPARAFVGEVGKEIYDCRW